VEARDQTRLAKEGERREDNELRREIFHKKIK
jgi:hypothetical protein